MRFPGPRLTTNTSGATGQQGNGGKELGGGVFGGRKREKEQLQCGGEKFRDIKFRDYDWYMTM